jgi:uncharacterized protein (DUF342 family)
VYPIELCFVRSLKASIASKGLSEEDQARFSSLHQETKVQEERINQLQEKLQKARAVRLLFFVSNSISSASSADLDIVQFIKQQDKMFREQHAGTSTVGSFFFSGRLLDLLC